jgi:hypothetical protein
LAINLIELLDSHEFRKKIATYVKDEGFYLNTMITSLKSMISCNVLDLKESFQGTCFDHAFSKMCQYATTYEKNYKRLKYLSIKIAQGDLQKCITWLEKSKMGRQEYENTCVNRSFLKGI